MDNGLLRQYIIEELEFASTVDAARIGIAVHKGVVTLSGHVRSYAELLKIEDAVWRVSGVKGIAQEMQVMREGEDVCTDEELVRLAVRQLESNIRIREADVRVRVEHGWITVKGDVEWQYQRNAISEALKNIPGITGLTNEVRVWPQVGAEDVRERIEKALKRHAEIEARHIEILVDHDKVTIEGRVDSPIEREAVKQAVRSAPGVTEVIDRMTL